MNLVFGHDVTVAEWASRHNDGLGRWPDHAWGVIDNQGVLRGALLLHVYNPWTWEMEMHGRVSNGVAKRFFRSVFGCGVQRLEIKASVANKGTRKAAPKWGFVFGGRLKNYYGPHGDAFVWAMTPEQCRWLEKESHGRERAYGSGSSFDASATGQ